MKLIVVEDNEQLAELLTSGLNGAGYETDRLATCAEACAALAITQYAALILDLNLPDGDGLSILQAIRNRKDPLPVLVLTARDGVHDRVNSLRSGADDYLVKPFGFEDLLARLETLLRRPDQMLGRSLHVGNVAFDAVSRQAFIDHKPRVLSACETLVLELLMRRQGRVVSKKLIEDQIFEASGEDASAVEVYVDRLRKELSENHATIIIHTIRGVGYLISEIK